MFLPDRGNFLPATATDFRPPGCRLFTVTRQLATSMDPDREQLFNNDEVDSPSEPMFVFILPCCA